MTVHIHVSVPYCGNIHRLSGKTSTFSTDLFIHYFINEFRLRERLSPSNHVHITLSVQVGYRMHIRIYFFDKKIQSMPSRSNSLIAFIISATTCKWLSAIKSSGNSNSDFYIYYVTQICILPNTILIQI